MNQNIILEVGCNNGSDTERLYRKYSGFPIYGFEPVPLLYAQLVEKFKDRSNVTIFQMAVDLENGVKKFNVNTTGNPRTERVFPYGASSLFEAADDVEEAFKALEIIKVKTITLETFLDNINFSGEITYLHCDAQGNDVNVLRSLGKYIKNLTRGQIEVSAQGNLYKNTQNTYDDAIRFLVANGFLIDIPKGLERFETDIYFRKAR